MPAFSVSKSIQIDKPADQVFASVRDFKQWPTWSPWLISEPDCQVDYADDGKSYSWNGKIIGSGRMQITSEDAPSSINYDLSFFKPFKSEAKVRFAFKANGEKTDVTWAMDSSLPFFMFFLKKMFVALIGSDYQRGLAMLKDYLEKGSVPSKLEFAGESAADGTDFFGITTTCATADIGPAMEKDMTKLGEWIKSSESTPSGPPFALYNKWDFVKGTATYTIAFPVATIPPSLPDDFTSGHRPACNAYKIKHTGAYRHLGNAWTSGYGRDRAKVFALDKKATAFEVYENDPQEVDEADILTTVHFPVK
ncbi:MAG: SRPBCC family protein [Verrucomicrobiota bacterium]